MKIAIVFAGNLRTFLMPLRENPNVRVCDILMQNIVHPTDGDVFAFTDSSDFYYGGKQYYSDNKKIEIINSNAYRIYDSVDFISYNDAVGILDPVLKSVFGKYLKSLVIESPFNISLDSRLDFLKEHDNMGCVPEFILQQYRKNKMAYNLLCNNEVQNKTNYDIIIKCRFDAFMQPAFNIGLFNFIDYDIFVPGIKGPVIFDWSAIGSRKAMHHYLSIYDHIGFPLEIGIVYMYECMRCGICIKEANNSNEGNPICPRCNRNDKIWIGNITLSPEHHIYETFRKENLRFTVSRILTHIYRYKNVSESQTLEEATKNLRIGKVIIRNHSTSKIVSENAVETGN